MSKQLNDEDVRDIQVIASGIFTCTDYVRDPKLRSG